MHFQSVSIALTNSPWQHATRISPSKDAMKTVCLKLTAEDGTQLTQIQGAFSDDVLKILQMYSGHMSRIREAGLIVRGMPFITRMEWQAGSMMKFTCPPFTNGELYELLHVLRPVILESEVASFKNVMALLGRTFKDRAFASHQKYIRRIFEDGELSMYMQFSLNDQKLLDDFLLRIWLNGTQYHTDQEKAEVWSKLEAGLTTETARAIVISQLHSRVKALFMLLHDVKLVIGTNTA